jgi:putative DNA primase/helicase
MDNLPAVLHQMQAFGIDLKDKDRDWIGSLHAGTEGKKKTIGAKGKDWCKLYLFRPDRGGVFITGSFGTYKHGGSWEKVDTEFVQISREERERQSREREAARARAAAAKAAEVDVAAMNALQLWRHASPTGRSPYLERKGLEGESCRYLPDGTLVILLLRYDLEIAYAIQAAQRILPDGSKFYSKGFNKPGCALRLGAVLPERDFILVVEGYATGLSVRAALERELPVFVALDAGNLQPVVEVLLTLYPEHRVLICADDDWRTRDPRTGDLTNPGRKTAAAIARQFPNVDYVYPAFNAQRPLGATDYDDLRQHQGLEVVTRQLRSCLFMLEKTYG